MTNLDYTDNVLPTSTKTQINKNEVELKLYPRKDSVQSEASRLSATSHSSKTKSCKDDKSPTPSSKFNFKKRKSGDICLKEEGDKPQTPRKLYTQASTLSEVDSLIDIDFEMDEFPCKTERPILEKEISQISTTDSTKALL